MQGVNTVADLIHVLNQGKGPFSIQFIEGDNFAIGEKFGKSTALRLETNKGKTEPHFALLELPRRKKQIQSGKKVEGWLYQTLTTRPILRSCIT